MADAKVPSLPCSASAVPQFVRACAIDKASLGGLLVQESVLADS